MKNLTKFTYLIGIILISNSYSNAHDIVSNKSSVASVYQKAQSDTAIIIFDKTTHDYGTILKGADGTATFTFKNNGNMPLILSNVKSSCGCTTPYWTKEPVAPGKTGEIKVKYDTNRMGNFQKSITISSNAKTTVLTIKGVVVLEK